MRCFSNLCRHRLHVTPLLSVPIVNGIRFCSTSTPTEDEVRKAYTVLGVAAGTTFVDIKRKYVDLAKEHHPDVSAASGPHRMVEINNAYNTISRFHKSGKELPKNEKGNGGQKTQQFYYSSQDPKYQPWHEDIDPLFYEMMWEEMKRQNEEDAFARSAHSDDFYTNFNFRESNQNNTNSKRKPQNFNGNSTNGYTNNNSNNNKKGHNNGPNKTKPKTTTWPDADLKALVNMYQDGKSFEFIANALGKTAAQVLDEFNRWSADSKKGQSSKTNRKKFSKRQKFNGYKVPYYFTESPDDIPFELHEMMNDEMEDGDPYGYYGDGDDGDSFRERDFDLYMGAKPYMGGHYMNEPKRGRNNNTRGTPIYNHNSFKSNSNRKNKK